MSYYSEDDVNVRFQSHGPRPARYVRMESPPRRYDGPSFLYPEQQYRTTVMTRSRSRSRSRDRPVPSPQSQPVIINDNRIIKDYSSSDDEDHHYHRRRSSSSRSRTRADIEAEVARRELERLRLRSDRESAERRLEKQYREGAEMKDIKRELEDIKRREARAADEARIKKELEHKRLKEEQQAAEEEERRKEEAKKAVEKYKQEEMERRAMEAKMREANEKEYQRRLQEDLIKSGVDEKAIAAIMKKEKIPEAEAQAKALGRPTYMRMARKHLSIETLRFYNIDWDYDSNPDYLLIKRWVPENEQDILWRHTRQIRTKRGKGLVIEEKHHHHHYEDDPRFEWVRKKSPSRHRSKSPNLLMYLAGARPA